MWLAREPGYRSRISYSDADYFSLSDKDIAIATAKREKTFPTLSQVELVLSVMPADSAIQRRDRALIALAMLTGARVGALASFRLHDVNVEQRYVDQDARHVRTKFSKTFRTYFMPVSEAAETIVSDWHAELSADVTRSRHAPLFPATALAVDENGAFAAAGLAIEGWRGTGPVREIFRRAFALVSLPYFNPHSFRDMLVHHAMSLNLPAEQMKAWSQNLGHSDLLTTLNSYGQVPTHRQGDLIRAAQHRDLPRSVHISTLESLLADLKGRSDSALR